MVLEYLVDTKLMLIPWFTLNKPIIFCKTGKVLVGL